MGGRLGEHRAFRAPPTGTEGQGLWQGDISLYPHPGAVMRTSDPAPQATLTLSSDSSPGLLNLCRGAMRLLHIFLTALFIICQALPGKYQPCCPYRCLGFPSPKSTIAEKHSMRELLRGPPHTPASQRES